jgi:hypothetical protein
MGMYNPFPLLTPGLLQDQLAKGKRYFVRQSFPRGMETRLKAAFLLRGYETEEKATAELHLTAIVHDGNAFLYDAGIPEHLERLGHAAAQPFGYKVFYAAKKGVDWNPPKPYQEKMKTYIRLHHPAWRTKKDGDKIQIGLYEEFGELFLIFSHEGENDRIPFDRIENY